MALGRLFRSSVGMGLDLVICTPVPPSTWYIQISLEPIPNCAFEINMYLPSGAQLGEVKSLLGSFETCFTPVPAGCMIPIVLLPFRTELEAFDLTAGDKFSWPSQGTQIDTSSALQPSFDTAQRH